ncbi:MAG: heavy-metal-associated domain-containing protein [Chitinophagaceae bacterium]
MKNIELKTNIMCDACIAKVTPLLNELAGASNWKVDTQNSAKILTVATEELNEDNVIDAVKMAGYKAEKVA